jgi:hypothetical protein
VAQFTTVTASLPEVQRPPLARRHWALAGAALVLLGATATALMTRQPAASGTQYVLIEKPPAVAPATPPASPSTALVAAPGPERGPEPPAEVPPVAAPVRPPSPAGKATAPRPDASSLTREFRRHQPRVETCIQQQLDQIERYPQISVRFQVNSAGKVTNAELTPPALAGQPLGACILGVARSVQFGPLSKPVAFSIPITARRAP